MPKRAEILALRRQLAREIVRSLGPVSAYCIAPSYGIPQPRMSELERDIVDRCSLEWLIERVYRMGGTVTVQVALGDAGRAWALEHSTRLPRPVGPTGATMTPPAAVAMPHPAPLIPNLE